MPAPHDLGQLLHDRLAEVSLSFLENDPGVRGDCSPDAVHDARVALRRTRSYLRTFARLLERGLALSIRADLKWYAAYLGGVRDLDVIADRLHRATEQVDDASAWPILQRLVADERANAVIRLRDSEGVARYQTVLAHMELLGDAPIVTPSDLSLGRLLERPWRDFRGSVKALHRPYDEARLHEVRIRAKDLRYGGELAARVESGPGDALSTAAGKLQERVGDHRDALAAAAFLEARTDLLGDASFLAGMLVLLERQQAAKALERVDDELRNVARRFKRLRRRSPERRTRTGSERQARRSGEKVRSVDVERRPHERLERFPLGRRAVLLERVHRHLAGREQRMSDEADAGLGQLHLALPGMIRLAPSLHDADALEWDEEADEGRRADVETRGEVA